MTLVDYDAEAEAYDRTRGGEPRAEAAAAAVHALLPATARTLLDLACGTGIVTARLGRPGLRVLGADPSYGMLRRAGARGVPVVLADGTRLPFAGGSLDAVSAVWLLHLLREPGLLGAVVAEVARVLRPGGVFLATVDKDAAHDVGSDIDAVLAPHLTGDPADAWADVVRAGVVCGLVPVGETGFHGSGQGCSPREAAEAVRAGRYASRVRPRTSAAALAGELESLPDPERRRGEPRYRLVAFRRTA
ncbi:class I SAM-dependent methyltransferase [Streptomyces bambusae]|uniref:class I SAM-dependent methyltransferase n=1 Tax=Streptomyces bambusae TaxID=1550616 RepID=UPI001CFC6E47|nr:class I SAM-dependent methyltransferase [Streptomyces bambusae]MCB5168951.1 class I SAM-dependent methyltransferase [Streptomyces bambusae]